MCTICGRFSMRVLMLLPVIVFLGLLYFDSGPQAILDGATDQQFVFRVCDSETNRLIPEAIIRFSVMDAPADLPSPTADLRTDAQGEAVLMVRCSSSARRRRFRLVGAVTDPQWAFQVSRDGYHPTGQIAMSDLVGWSRSISDERIPTLSISMDRVKGDALARDHSEATSR